MRIRKNARRPQMLQQSHLCQLNQSPWDVIPFGLASDLLELEDSFTATGSPGDSIGAFESVASMMHGSNKLEDLSIRNEEEMTKDEDKKSDDNGGKGVTGLNKEARKKRCCQKNDGKGWHCKKEAREGHSFCDYHFNLLRSYNISVEPPSGGPRTRATRAAKKAASASSNPYEFHYYSGFGPSWRKRRGDRGGTEGSKIADEKAGNQSNISSPSSPETDSLKFDYIDDEDDEDEEEDNNGDTGKKRMRKPVKARSLKSLIRRNPAESWSQKAQKTAAGSIVVKQCLDDEKRQARKRKAELRACHVTSQKARMEVGLSIGLVNGQPKDELSNTLLTSASEENS